MKKKVIVLGSMGMAGHIVTSRLKQEKKHDVLGVARQEGVFVDKKLDVTDFSQLKEYLSAIKPQYVVNCIGALVSQSEKHLASAILINSYLPHFLVECGRTISYKLIHISTDCVFSGQHGSYTEDSFRDGDNNYARSKSLGEVDDNENLTLRTSIIGPELKLDGNGLFDFFLKQQEPIQGFTKTYWSGITTLELANIICKIVDGHDLRGIYHLTNGEPISKYGLLVLFKEYTQKIVKINGTDGYVSDKTLINTRKELKHVVPDYPDMEKEMVAFMKNHPDLYNHYVHKT